MLERSNFGHDLTVVVHYNILIGSFTENNKKIHTSDETYDIVEKYLPLLILSLLHDRHKSVITCRNPEQTQTRSG